MQNSYSLTLAYTVDDSYLIASLISRFAHTVNDNYLVASLQACDIGLLLTEPFGPMIARALGQPVSCHEDTRQTDTCGRHACM